MRAGVRQVLFLADKIPEPDFDAPLIKSLELRRGVGSATFTRASTATVFGYAPDAMPGDAQVLLTVDANEPRFEGARRASSGVWDDKYSDGSPISANTLKGYLAEGKRTNLFLNSDVGATQSITVTAQAYTVSFWGTGSIELSGAATGTLNGTGANDRVSLTFTPSAGSVTLTITGSVLKVNFEAGAFASSYIPTTSASVTRNADVLSYPATSNISITGSVYVETIEHGWINLETHGDSRILGTNTFEPIWMRASGSNKFYFYDGVLRESNIALTSYGSENIKKIASKWSNGVGVFFKAGAASADITLSNPVVISGNLKISHDGYGGAQHFGTIRNVKIWKKALKDKHLMEITK